MVYKQLFNPIKLNLTFSLLILTLIVFLRCFIIQVQAKLDNNGPRGVAKSKAHLYEKKGSTWMCLDGLVTIPYEAINDDYCDCADGSDEPGTSACPNGKFYCTNAGHIPSYISSRRVNDGVCEPECCDGSDEYDGKVECPNVCEKVGAEYRRLAEQLAKTRSEGARIKNEVYIQHGKKLKQHHESELERLKVLLEASMIKVTEREAALKKAQEKEKAESTAKDHVHIKYKEKIRLLREHNERLQDKIDILLGIFGNMKKNHNQNYHDMAVKTAIKGYDEFIEEYEKEMEENIDFEDDEIDEDEINVESETPHVPITKPSLSEQISDALLGIYNDVLETIGLSEYVISNPGRQLSGVGKSKEVIAAQDAYDKAKEERRKLESEIEDINKKLAKDYGPKQEFAKLDGECFSHDAEEYTYTVCTFGKATQKSNKDHATTNLGQFEKWIGAESKGDYKYYSSQLYGHGTKCWNGPTRSVKLYLECGTENKILSVSEPEKCEYVMKMTTPAICPENAEGNEGKDDHDEL